MTGEPLLDGVSPALPEDLRAFLECTADTATIRNGPVTWVEIPAERPGACSAARAPSCTVTPGPPRTALLKIKAGWIGGDTAGGGRRRQAFGRHLEAAVPRPASIATEIQPVRRREFNARLAANGKALGAPSIGPTG